MSTATLKNIIIIGGGGSLGSVVLDNLLDHGHFQVTILQRTTSQTSFPTDVSKVVIADDYPFEDLVAAFTGQDAVINMITSGSVSTQYRFIDAAISAGIKRYIPSEFGIDNTKLSAQSLCPIFKEKAEIQAYLRSKESTGMTWTSIMCGAWLAWHIQRSLLGLRIKECRAFLYDGGKNKFSCISLENVALAIRNILLKPTATENRLLAISDFAASQNDIVEVLERATGNKFAREDFDSDKVIENAKASFANGDFKAAFTLVEVGICGGEYGSHLEENWQLSNELLELKKYSIDEEVKKGLKLTGYWD